MLALHFKSEVVYLEWTRFKWHNLKMIYMTPEGFFTDIPNKNECQGLPRK